MNKQRTTWTACALTAVLMGIGAPAFAGDGGRLVDLGVQECARDINDRGVVVTDTRVVRDGRSAALPGGLETAARINDAGQVAGTVGGVAALWDGRRTVVIGLAAPDHTYSYVTGLNERGEVVGTSGGGADGTTVAFRWSRGVLTVLPGTGVSGASDISDRGDVVGYVTVDGTQRAVRWGRDGAPVQLATLGGAGGASLAASVNKAGQVAGYAYTAPGGTMRAVRWDASDAITDVSPAGASFSGATDISSQGVVVGDVVPAGSTQRGFVRGRDGVSRPVAPLHEGASAVFTAVNDKGWVVGCETYGDDGTAAVLWR